MSRKGRYVFDTNAVVSAALCEQGKPGKGFYWALDNGEMLLSDDVAREIDEVLSRVKFEPYITQEEREGFLQRLIAETRLVEITDLRPESSLIRWSRRRRRKRDNNTPHRIGTAPRLAQNIAGRPRSGVRSVVLIDLWERSRLIKTFSRCQQKATSTPASSSPKEIRMPGTSARNTSSSAAVVT